MKQGSGRKLAGCKSATEVLRSEEVASRRPGPKTRGEESHLLWVTYSRRDCTRVKPRRHTLPPPYPSSEEAHFANGVTRPRRHGSSWKSLPSRNTVQSLRTNGKKKPTRRLKKKEENSTILWSLPKQRLGSGRYHVRWSLMVKTLVVSHTLSADSPRGCLETGGGRKPGNKLKSRA